MGGVGALWLRGMNLNLSASIGFIALFGVAMLNGVVLVSSINQLRLGRSSDPGSGAHRGQAQASPSPDEGLCSELRFYLIFPLFAEGAISPLDDTLDLTESSLRGGNGNHGMFIGRTGPHHIGLIRIRVLSPR